MLVPNRLHFLLGHHLQPTHSCHQGTGRLHFRRGRKVSSACLDHECQKSILFASRNKLRLMASTSAEGKQLYNDWVIKDNRSIVQVLDDMRSCKPSLEHLCELLPRLQPRYYSISSSPKVNKLFSFIEITLLTFFPQNNSSLLPLIACPLCLCHLPKYNNYKLLSMNSRV
jgi:FAD binding domain